MNPKLLPSEDGDRFTTALFSRRGLLLAGAGGVGACLSGRMLMQWLERRRRATLLIEAADRILLPTRKSQVATMPKKAADDVNRFFAGVCLQVHRFTSLICSSKFCEKLRTCNDENQRRLLLDEAFSTRLVSEVKINEAVQQVIQETSKVLNADWATACGQLARTWGKSGFGAPEGLSPELLEQRLNSLIAITIQKIQATTYPLAQRPSLTETGLEVTRAAIELLPMARFGAQGYLPLFIVVGLAHLWSYIAGQLAHRELDYRHAISVQLSLLSRRIAGECEQAFQSQIAKLHSWQRHAVERVSWQIAGEAIALLP